MDISAITALNSVNGTATVSPTSLTGMLAEKEKKAEGTMFETFLNTAIDNVKITNSYLSDAENEKIRFALVRPTTPTTLLLLWIRLRLHCSIP